MKIKLITCDVCGKDITKQDFRYKGKIKVYESDYAKWERLDVCQTCMIKFAEFVKRSDNNAE